MCQSSTNGQCVSWTRLLHMLVHKRKRPIRAMCDTCVCPAMTMKTVSWTVFWFCLSQLLPQPTPVDSCRTTSGGANILVQVLVILLLDSPQHNTLSFILFRLCNLATWGFPSSSPLNPLWTFWMGGTGHHLLVTEGTPGHKVFYMRKPLLFNISLILCILKRGETVSNCIQGSLC